MIPLAWRGFMDGNSRIKGEFSLFLMVKFPFSFVISNLWTKDPCFRIHDWKLLRLLDWFVCVTSYWIYFFNILQVISFLSCMNSFSYILNLLLVNKIIKNHVLTILEFKSHYFLRWPVIWTCCTIEYLAWTDNFIL